MVRVVILIGYGRECNLKAYMTNGTVDFLEKLEKKHPELLLKLMNNNEGALAYYEHPTKSIFQSGRTYEVLTTVGDVKATGYVVMNNIPVSIEGKPVFEDRFVNREQTVENMPGFQAFRLLRPTRGNTYVVFTQWASKTDFENWKNSPEFADAHKKQTAKPPAYFAERPFISTFHMYVEEED